MKKSYLIPVVLSALLTVWAVPAVIHSADNQDRPFGPPRVPPFFAEKYDADSNGKLSAAEEKAAWEAFLNQYDTDKDGKLSKEEMKVVMEDEHKAFFDKADTDQDGTLTWEEFDVAMANIPMGPPRPGVGFGCPGKGKVQ